MAKFRTAASIYMGNTLFRKKKGENSVEMGKKSNEFSQMCGTIRRILLNKRIKIRKETQVKFYKTMTIPTLACRSGHRLKNHK